MFNLEIKKEDYTAPGTGNIYWKQKFNLTVSFETQSGEADLISDFKFAWFLVYASKILGQSNCNVKTLQIT